MARYGSVFQAGLFAGQVAVVTGGGSGIGRCTAHELAALGAAVAIIGRKPEKLEAVRAEIEAAGGVCSTHVCDIREEAVVRATVEAVLQRHGRIDSLVNNAGGQFPSPLSMISAKGWDAVVHNNLTGGFLMARECVTQWMAAHGGAIVNIIADIWHGWPDFAHSGASRGGMLTLSAGGRTGRWPITVIEDRAPTAEFVEEPSADSDGRLSVAVRIDDDYGAVAAALRLRLDPSQERPLDAPAIDAAVESRLIAIDGVAGPPGTRAFSVDLQADPWAGLKVIVPTSFADES